LNYLKKRREQRFNKKDLDFQREKGGKKGKKNKGKKFSPFLKKTKEEREKQL